VNGMEKVGYYNNKEKVYNSYSKDSSRSKPLRYGQDSFVKELIGKTIQIELTNGKILTGKLLDLGMYDVMIELKSTQNYIVSDKTLTKDVNKNLIVMKSAIISVEVVTK